MYSILFYPNSLAFLEMTHAQEREMWAGIIAQMCFYTQLAKNMKT
jgi:hypothetical protein